MFPKSLYIIFILSLLIKLLTGFVLLAGEAPEVFEYETLADNLLAGKGFVYMFYNTPYKAFIQPLHPLFTAFIYRLTNHSQIVMLAIQCLMSSALCFIIYSIARRLTGVKEALVAATLVAFHPGLIVYSVLKLHALTFYAFFYLLTLSLALRFMKKPNFKNALLWGIIIGLTLLSRATILIFVIFALLYLRPKLKYLSLICLSVAILYAPWVVRNYVVFNDFVFFLTTSGEALWVGNNENASGSELLPNGEVVSKTMPKEMYEEVIGLDELGQNRYFKKRVFNFIKKHPLLCAKLFIKKFYYFWWFAPQTGLWYPRLWLSIFKVYYGIIFSFFAIGAFLASRDKPKRRILIILFLYMLSLAFLHAASIVDVRHRWTVEPIMIIFSSIGFFAIVDFIKRRSSWVKKT